MKNKEISLVVFAAGMGTRFGGLKQIAEVGPEGECLLDYTLYDAKQAGFSKIIFIIQQVFEVEFRAKVVTPWENEFQIEVVYQSTQNLPSAYEGKLTQRTSPWGTSHALWIAREVVQEPFAIINADDFYGQQALKQVAEFLLSSIDTNTALIVAYELQQTLSKQGTVNRGVCNFSKSKELISIDEHTAISLDSENEKISGLSSFKNSKQDLAAKSLVSMNLWGFHPEFMNYVDEKISDFWEQLIHQDEAAQLKQECYLPSLVTQAIEEKSLNCKIEATQSPWMGMTYAEDLETVRATLKQMHEKSDYPLNFKNS